MLEIKTYTMKEICEVLHSDSKSSIKKKLSGYGVQYKVKGRGDDSTFTIEKLNDPFKVFCIIELGFPAQSNFEHLRHFMYHFFCDDEFISMPDEVKEQKLNEYDYHISRQTIGNYERRLKSLNYIDEGGDYYYYFAYKGKQIITTKETYCQAWREYWEIRSEGSDSLDAICYMRAKYGGVARKQPKIEKNAFYLEKINYLIDMIGNSIEQELPN